MEPDPEFTIIARSSAALVARPSFSLEIVQVERSALKRDLYLPIPFIEAIGRATVARSQLELSFNIMVAVLGSEATRSCTCRPCDALETKIDYLGTVSRSRLLKHEWWQRLRRIASSAKKLNQQYSNAAMGSLYSRGGGYLEEIMRPLAERTNVAPALLTMTPGRIDSIAREFRELTGQTAELAASLLDAVDTLSMTKGDQQEQRPRHGTARRPG